MTYLPWLWIVGTPTTFLLLAAGIIGTKRLRHASRPIDDGLITETLAKLSQSLRNTKRVTIAVCDRIAAPVLIGILRPIILLPPAALTGWSPDEIEMVLLHELAHVRRWDNLINLLQRFIESLLFFHPAVWLTSTWVRREREACCDAVVVARTHRPHAYAELLVSLAATRSPLAGTTPLVGLAFSRHPLAARIRRILELEDDPMLISGKSFALMLATLLALATIAVLYLPTVGQAEESTTEITERTEKSPSSKGREEPQAARHAPIAQTQNNLKNLALAILNYEATYRALPPHAKYDASGKPVLSWRVMILPFLDQADLYEEFRLDEPWDSEHNRKLLARMPDEFKNPKLNEPTKTNYLAVVGEECVFTGTPNGIKFSRISDGTARTIALVEADADQAVEWTKPEDWQFDRNAPTSHLGGLWGDRWHAAWIDGSVRGIFTLEPRNLIGIQFTCAGGETRSLEESTPESKEGADKTNASRDESTDANQTEPSDKARIAGFEKALQEKISLIVVMFNDSRGYYRHLRRTYEKLAREGKTIYLFGIEIDPASNEAKRYGIGPTPPLIIFRDGKETARLEKIENAEQLNEFVAATLGRGDRPKGKFPSLEDQKLADLAWKRLELELEPIGEEDVKRVQALGYDGGLRITSAPSGMGSGGILVGLHAWPTTSLADVVEVLNREDLAELSPLKYYIIDRNMQTREDVVRTGRISVKVDPRPQRVDDNSDLQLKRMQELQSGRKSALRYDGKTFDDWRRELQMLDGLFYNDLAVAQRSRKYLSKLPKSNTAAVVSRLAGVMPADLNANRRIAAIRALAAIGPPAESAIDILKERLASEDPQERIAAAAAIKMIVGKDQYQKPIAEVLGEELGITVAQTDSGAWAALPRDDSSDPEAFGKFNDAVIKEQQILFPADEKKARD
ncbi:MAG: M56 family metallopeptidase [Pirellulales bacterium]